MVLILRLKALTATTQESCISDKGKSLGSDSQAMYWWALAACPCLCLVLLGGHSGPFGSSKSCSPTALPGSSSDPPTSKGLEEIWGWSRISVHSQLPVCGHSYPPGRKEENTRSRSPFLWLQASWAFVRSPKFGVGWLLKVHQPPATLKYTFLSHEFIIAGEW